MPAEKRRRHRLHEGLQGARGTIADRTHHTVPTAIRTALRLRQKLTARSLRAG